MSELLPQSQLDLKYNNLKLVYTTLRDEGPMPRITLSKRTGLSPTSMTRIVSNLSDMGLVHTCADEDKKGIGRPAVMLDIEETAAYCYCVHVSGNKCKLAIVNLKKRFISYKEISFTKKIKIEAFIELIEKKLSEMTNECGISREKICYCGVSLSGHVISDTGYIVASGQLKWYEVDAKKLFEDKLNMPVLIENDCKSALIGEFSIMKNENEAANNVSYIEFGPEGVGSAAIVDGRMIRGTRNAAGEIGHFTMMREDSFLNNSRRVYLESIISEKAIIKRALELNPEYNGIEKISQYLNKDDENLNKLVDEVMNYTLIAINDIVCAYNPDKVILNGKLVTFLSERFNEALINFNNKFMNYINPNLEISVAKMGNNSSLYGAVCIVEEKVVSNLLRKNCS